MTGDINDAYFTKVAAARSDKALTQKNRYRPPPPPFFSVWRIYSRVHLPCRAAPFVLDCAVDAGNTGASRRRVGVAGTRWTWT